MGAGVSKQTFPVNGQIINILGFVSPVVSVASTHVFPYRGKVVIDNLSTNGCGQAPIKFY